MYDVAIVGSGPAGYTAAIRGGQLGLVEETRGLLERYGPVKALDALGYKQAMAVARGEMSEAEAIQATQQGHRNYAKRQLTWFRREPEVRWIAGFGDDAETARVAMEWVGESLSI